MIYKKRSLIIDGFKPEILGKKYSTPLYFYSLKTIKKNIINFKKNFKKIDPLICFAVKANSNKIILQKIGKLGLGADVVSMGELMKALKSGIKPNKIVFSGVGKTSKEITFAIEKNILLINAESKSEILEIEKIAKSKKRKISVGIRLNPNIDAKTLSQISTGKKENKFGVSEKIFLDLVNYTKNSKFLNLKCLSVHIGSQILDHKPYEKMLKILQKVIYKTKFKFEFIDLGGGMGIDYERNNKILNFKKYASSIKKFLKKNNCKIIFEPGRSIVGNTAVLLTKVIYIKKSSNKKFIILDAGMNDLIRPALYNAMHDIIPLTKRPFRNSISHDFVGPICETSDRFLKTKNFQKINEGDDLAIKDVGAYGIVLTSNYNLRTRPMEIIIKNSTVKKISKKQSLNDIV